MRNGLFKQRLKSDLKRFKKKETMKVGEIDEDFKYIIDLLNQKGFKPFASCDGVLAHHSEGKEPLGAYISFMDSQRIIDLLAALSRDSELFCLEISSGRNIPYSLYGNLIRGKQFRVGFSNSDGSVTRYFEKIITKTIDGSIKVSKEEKLPFKKIVTALDKDKRSDLRIYVTLNGEYQPYMKTPGKINSLRITTECSRDMYEMSEILSERYGICKKIMLFNEGYEEDIFITAPDSKECAIYFKDEHFDRVLSMLPDIRQIGKTLPIREDYNVDYVAYKEWQEDLCEPDDSEDAFAI